MIIDCICGLKKFEVNADQIPTEGRQVKCGVCSKEWFYKPVENDATLQLDQTNLDTSNQINDDVQIPSSTEEAISAAEQDEKMNFSFDDDDNTMPSKSEMDENLEKFKAERKKKKKSSLSQGARTRMLVYLLILLLLALVTVSIPYKDSVLAVFPELSIVFEGLTPLYQAIFK
ncbi:MJ0042-type zinc finger domain-containing protein [Candidatus Pelagibacter sp. HIMB1517]|uniref:MJ0042-type zinc finger domain-containing protein n=1 Tax=Candidatus Pelagibacter sp. HIMB1517 TaxID=3413341 RepID=UPI003F83A594